MSRVLVTGGAGYVGSHGAKALAKAGHQVLVIDDLSTGFRQLARYGRFEQGSLLDRAFIDKVIQEFKPEATLHFAARATVGESVRDPELYHRINVKGSEQLLDALRRHVPESAFLFSSSCAVYAPTSEPLREDHAFGPVSPYGETKLLVEKMLETRGKEYGLRFASLRYFNAAGADTEGEIGEMHQPETHLIPLLLLQCRGSGAAPVKIFGKDYPTRDGTCIRDYVHVEDLASAHLAAMDYLLKGGDSLALNLGTATGHTVLEVVAMVEKVTGKKLPRDFAPRREGDPAQLVADGRAIRSVLGWKPQHDLESIVRSAWNWVQKL